MIVSGGTKVDIKLALEIVVSLSLHVPSQSSVPVRKDLQAQSKASITENFGCN